jgi:hypothetical protein
MRDAYGQSAENDRPQLGVPMLIGTPSTRAVDVINVSGRKSD